MMRKASSCFSSRGNPFLHSTTLVVLFNNYMTRTSREFRSQSSHPATSRETHPEKLSRDPHPPSVPIVRDLQHALNVFDEMLQRTPLPSVVRFTQILAQLVKMKHHSNVITMSNQMVLCGIGPNHYTLSIIMNCFCHLNRMGLSLSVLGQFFKLGFQPDVITYTTLINGFVLKNRVQEAAGIFSKMLQGGHCVPNVVTFNTIIKGLCRRGDKIAAIRLFKKMEERGCQPNVVSYSTIIDSLCKESLVVDAMNLLSEMVSRGIAPDLFSSLSSKGVVPDVRTYNVMINGLCNGGLLVEAVKLLREMGSKGCPPNGCTYNTIIRGFFNNNEISRAVQLLEEMKEMGFSGDASTMELVIDLLSKDKVDPALLSFLNGSK